MTTARSQLIDSESPGYYHCVSRCVRRAFLCGEDQYSGRSFEHRKNWVEERLLALSEMFAVGLYAYAVMSNHVHVVLYVDPVAVQLWSDEEVAERWVRLFPVRENGEIAPEACRWREQTILGDAERLACYRQRLGSLSWFMRCLAEPIARRANREDGCTGRFWEGRYKCQALLDDNAVLACMAYVDLNPIRAGIAPDIPSSANTAIKRRFDSLNATQGNESVKPIASSISNSELRLNLKSYLELVDWTGRRVRSDKLGAMDHHTPAVLTQLGIRERQWQAQVLGIESRYWRAVGAVDALIEKAKALGQHWLKGYGLSRRLAALR